jgi:hypothetical protein
MQKWHGAGDTIARGMTRQRGVETRKGHVRGEMLEGAGMQ